MQLWDEHLNREWILLWDIKVWDVILYVNYVLKVIFVTKHYAVHGGQLLVKVTDS